MSDKYYLLMYFIHSHLESERGNIVITETTTVENFRDNEINNAVCKDLFDKTISQWDYELSHNQMCNGINLFLKGLAKTSPPLLSETPQNTGGNEGEGVGEN